MAILTTITILCPICRAQNRGDARFCQSCGQDVLLDNIYRITNVVKEGGMGTVYKAVDESGAEYAVKEMHDRFATPAEREDGIERFVEEADLLRKLRHPAIPRVYRSFIDEGRYYLAMEFIHGEDLEDRLKREGSIAEPIVLGWADQVCDVLEYMHSQGLIYRDMKPANVMITRDGAVKVIDFGIAKLLQPGQRGTMIGTPGYAPPEQYQGLASRQSDIYALAASLHHILTGRDPREHPPFSFPPANEVNPAISAQTSMTLEKALSMDEAHRFRTAGEFRAALPIPTGDRRPTLPFDLPRTPEPAPQPRPAQPKPQPQPAQPKPQPRPVQPKPQPKPVPPPYRPQLPLAKPVKPQPPAARRPSVVGRLFTTALLVVGLTYGSAVAAPAVVLPIIERVIPAALIEQLPGIHPVVPSTPPVINVQPAPQPSAPLPVISDLLNYDIELTLPEGQAPTITDFRNAFLEQARQDLPGAEFISAKPTYSDGLPQPVGDPVNGQQTYRASMRGQVAYPQK